jgi:hypothetical protein
LRYVGATGLALDDDGALLIETGIGVLRDLPPVAYQMIDGVRVAVTSRFVLTQEPSGWRYGFVVGDYDGSRELIIDPGVEYSTFLGGSSHELGAGVAVDAAGNAYVVGTTQSPNFPTTMGAFRRTGAAGNFGDVFVSKLNATGERVTSSPAGINVATGSSGSASFASGTAITLSVTNGRDAIWSGACSSGGSKRRTCTFTLTGTAAVTANVQ